MEIVKTETIEERDVSTAVVHERGEGYRAIVITSVSDFDYITDCGVPYADALLAARTFNIGTLVEG